MGTWTVNEFPEYQEAFTFENKDNFPWLVDFHVTDDKIRTLMEQFMNYTVKLSEEELQAIEPEVLMMIGDDDLDISLA